MGKTVTREEYVTRLAEKNPTVELIGDYIKAKEPAEHHCLIHDVYWKIRPASALLGSGCPMCHRERNIQNTPKTHEKYVAEVAVKNPNIIVLGTYVNSNTHILHKCKIHEIEWETSPASILQGSGCKECMKEKLHNQKAKTHEEYGC